MTTTKKAPGPTTLLEKLMEAVFLGRTMRDGDKAFIREVLRMQKANDDMLAVLRAAERAIPEGANSDDDATLAMIRAAIAKATGGA